MLYTQLGINAYAYIKVCFDHKLYHFINKHMSSDYYQDVHMMTIRPSLLVYKNNSTQTDINVDSKI